MALQIDLMGAGMPGEQAVLLGQGVLASVTAAGTTAGTATAITGSQTQITSAAGATGVILPATATLTRLFFIRNLIASTAPLNIYPPTGGRINNMAANAPLIVPAGESALLMIQVQTSGATIWVGYSTSDGGTGNQAIAGQTASPRTIAVGGLVPAVSTDFTDATPVITEVYLGEVLVPMNTTVTGVAIFNGSNVTGNVKAGLYDSTGALVAQTASTAGSGTDAYQRIAFTAPYTALGPATYYIANSFSSATARYNSPPLGSFGASVVTAQVFGTLPLTVTPPTTFTTNVGPIASLY